MFDGLKVLMEENKMAYKFEHQPSYRYGRDSYPISEKIEVFNDTYWYCDNYDQAVEECVDILFEYYWHIRDFKNNWMHLTRKKVMVCDYHIDDNDARQVIAELFVRKILNYYDPACTECSPWTWGKRIMEQHFCLKLAQLSSVKTPDSRVEKQDLYESEDDVNIISLDDCNEESNSNLSYSFDFDALCDKMLLSDVIDYIDSKKHGYVLLKRYGIDRGYKRTVAETAQELGLTPKKVNYWCDKIITDCQEHFKEVA